MNPALEEQANLVAATLAEGRHLAIVTALHAGDDATRLRAEEAGNWFRAAIKVFAGAAATICDADADAIAVKAEARARVLAEEVHAELFAGARVDAGAVDHGVSLCTVAAAAVNAEGVMLAESVGLHDPVEAAAAVEAAVLFKGFAEMILARLAEQYGVTKGAARQMVERVARNSLGLRTKQRGRGA